MQYNTTLTPTPHVWLRLRGEIEGLVMEREGGCLVWLHRQLKEAAEQRYAAKKPSLHATMGQYFADLTGASTLIAPQPLVVGSKYNSTSTAGSLSHESMSVWLPDAIVNKRRCIEAAHHLIEAGKPPKLFVLSH
jgi:hypothetical protein